MLIAIAAIMGFLVYHYNKHYLQTKDPSLKGYIAYMREWLGDITGYKK